MKTDDDQSDLKLSGAANQKKTGRNAPCPCGSGKKYKHCHGSFAAPHTNDLPPHVWAALDQKRKEVQALSVQREKQQGLGRPIVSCLLGDQRIVGVGMKLHFQKADRWKTFHVFLSDHFHSLLGLDWVKAEKAKPESEKHPIVRWVEQAGQDLKRYGEKVGPVISGPMTGAMRSYLNLAYNIYLIAHHAPSKDERIVRGYVSRLKSARSEHFIGALFETYAAAAFLKAGFELEFEDEADSTSSHVEFVARYPKTGKSFSVEVKARDWQSATSEVKDLDARKLRVASKLNAALSKSAKHPRVIFIEVNVPDIVRGSAEIEGWVESALKEVRDNESVNARQSAYVIVTNHAFHNNLDAFDANTAILATGFNIPDFGPDVKFEGYKAVLASRERHVEMFSLLKSMQTHYEIPSTFDGDMADLAFLGDDLPRLKLGNVYSIPDKDGSEIAGRFYEATVDVRGKKVTGVFELADGRHVMASMPLTDAEVAAYQRHPETFFGEVRKPPGNVETLIDACDFFYEAYQNTKRERLLDFMAKAPDIKQLEQLSQKDLAITYAERCALAMFAERSSSKK